MRVEQVTMPSLRGTGNYLGAVVFSAHLASRLVRLTYPDLPPMPWEAALALSLHHVNRHIAQNGTTQWD